MKAEKTNGIHTNMMEIQEKQDSEQKSGHLDIRHPESPDTMMNLHILDAPNVNAKVKEMRTDLGNIQIQENVCRMRNEETETADILEVDHIEKIMHEQQIHWDLEKAMAWDDQYTIHLTEPEEKKVTIDEDRKEAVMLTNME